MSACGILDVMALIRTGFTGSRSFWMRPVSAHGTRGCGPAMLGLN
jgi:hypothetical protein